MDILLPEIPARFDRFRKTVRDFVVKNRPHVVTKQRSGFRTPEFRKDVDELQRWVGEMYSAGYSVFDRRERDGEADIWELRVIIEELEELGVPWFVGNPNVAEAALRAFGSPWQKSELLPRMRSGKDIWCQCFSEPDAGSDLASLKTRATRDGDQYIINGQKIWTTWGQYADYGFLLARTNAAVEKHAGITAFAVPLIQDGVQIRPLREITGTADFNEVFLTDAKVPVANRIGEEDDGWRVAKLALRTERISTMGMGDLMVDDVLRLIDISTNQEGPDGRCDEDSAIQQHLARAYEIARIVNLLGLREETRTLQGHDNQVFASVGKLFYGQTVQAISDAAMAMLETRSILVEDEPLAVDDGRWVDMFLYMRAMSIAGGTAQIQRNLISELGLGMPREQTWEKSA